MFEGRWQGEDELGMGGRAQKSGLFAVVCGRHPSLMFFLLEVLGMMRGGLWPVTYRSSGGRCVVETLWPALLSPRWWLCSRNPVRVWFPRDIANAEGGLNWM